MPAHVGKHQQTVQIGEREQSERNSMECRAAMRMTLFWRDPALALVLELALAALALE
jgi:hypothetical protein